MNLQISVKSPLADGRKQVTYFERMVELPDSIQFPFHDVIMSLHLLFRGLPHVISVLVY